MTARTADGQPEHRGADGGELVVEFVVALLLGLVGGDLRRVRAGAEKSGNLVTADAFSIIEEWRLDRR